MGYNINERQVLGMCTKLELTEILTAFTKDVREIFGNKLIELILFGSYARGDYDEESDVDIAILADVINGQEHVYYNQLTKLIGDIDEKFGYRVLLSPIIINAKLYEEWKNDLPFYRNIDRESVKIVA